ncbi:MAG: ArsR/SmtB family transcription factor [Rhodoglobus sp.]
MHPYEVLAEPIRRRLVQILASGEHTAGELEGVITHEFGVGRTAVQHHLRLLLACGWTDTRDDWPNHWYHLKHGVVEHIEREVHDLRVLWDQRVGWNGEGRAKFDPTASRKGRRGLGWDPDNIWLHVFD